MAVYLTGDTHGNYDIDKLNMRNWPQQKELTEEDFVIILGDFGFIWNDQPDKEEKFWLNWFDDKNFTTLFLDGNHDNHNRLASYPTQDFHGGIAQQVSKKVWHLMRGEYYTFCDKTFWTMGGARSHDIQDGILDLSKPADADLYKEWSKDYSKRFRVLNVDWWEQEVPSDWQRFHGLANFEFHDNKVDFILTHEPPASCSVLLGYKDPNEYSKWLESEVRCKQDYGKWYFGHMHVDYAINDRDICLYNRIEQVV